MSHYNQHYSFKGDHSPTHFTRYSYMHNFYPEPISIKDWNENIEVFINAASIVLYEASI